MEKTKKNQLWRLPLLILSLAVLAYSIAFLFWGLVPCVGKIQFFAEIDSKYIIPGWPQTVSLPFIYWFIWNAVFIFISTSAIVLTAHHLGKQQAEKPLLVWKFGLSIGLSVGLLMAFTIDPLVGSILAAIIWFAFREETDLLGSMIIGLVLSFIFGFLFGFIYSVLIILLLVIILGVILALKAFIETKLFKKIRSWVEGK